MTDLTRPVVTPVTELLEELAELGRAGLDAAAEQEVDDLLASLAADTVRLVAADDHDEFCGALASWGRHFAELVAVLFAGAAAVGQELTLLGIATLVKRSYPRLGAVLSLAGVIVDHPIAGSTIDREALAEFLRNPPALIDEQFWDDLFDTDDIEGTGRLPAMLLALLLLAPDTIGAMRRGELRLAPLEPPPVGDTASPSWRALRERSRGWIPIVFPFRVDDDGRLVLEDLTGLGDDPTPDLPLSVLVRSQRRAVDTSTVTDFELWVHPGADAERHELRTGSGLVARLEPGVRVGLGYDGGLGTWNAAIRPRAGPRPARASILLRAEDDEGRPGLSFGPPYDTRLIVRDLAVELILREDDEPSVELVGRIDGLALVVTNRWFRSLGFGGSTLREGLRVETDLEASVTEGAGFELAVDGGLATVIHKEVRLGGDKANFTLHSIAVFVPIRATQDHFDVRAELRVHWSATLGPIVLVVDGAGGWVGWWADEPGGDKECIGLLPPTGIGLQADLPGGVTAGGFLDFTGGPNDRYGGVLTVVITGPEDRPSPFSVTAFGIHELAGRPGQADRDRSLIIVLGTTFSPGFPVGFGFSLIGVGGLYGWRRRADTDALRERLTSGAVGNILFADDPIRNAPILLGDLGALFPPASTVDVLGITLRLGWLPLLNDHLVKVAVGVIVEYPHPIGLPTKVIVIGSARAAVPRFPKILDLQIDVVGIVDAVNATLEIDATIRKGRLFGVFTLSGDAAVRASWGDRKYLMATVGGFHPDFHPEPAVFPKLARLKMAIDKGILPKGVKVEGTAYVAVTTNTIQFGAELNASIKLGNWSINGMVGGDAIIERSFAFDVEVRGKVSVKYRRFTIASVGFKGGISGPSPTILRGEVCIEVLWKDICFSDSWRLGDGGLPTSEIVTSLVPLLAAELRVAANLRATGTDDGLVRLEPVDRGPGPAFDPRSALVWEQDRVPLGLRIDKIEADRLAAPQRVTVTTAGSSVASDPVEDWFGTGQFVDLSESETLALPAFERHRSGVALRFDQRRSGPVPAEVEIEEIRIPGGPGLGAILHLPEWLVADMAIRDESADIDDGPGRFGFADVVFGGELADQVAVGSEVDAYRVGGAEALNHPADRLVDLVV